MESNQTKTNACVLVLGDWGRSPRMQYHAVSLASQNFLVDVIAYKGARCSAELKNNKNINVTYMREVPRFDKYVPKLLAYILKTLWQSLFLFIPLLIIQKPKILILQNPPSVPTLPVTWLACWIRGTKLLIDFHNYGFTLLEMSIGKKNSLVQMCKWCEKYFGRRAACCLCVSEAMKSDLAEKWGVMSHVFYDCPPEKFHPIEVEEKHELFHKLGELNKVFKRRHGDPVENTRFTSVLEGDIQLLNSRPPLLVSSTSWTEDEDFSILLSALEEYENTCLQNPMLPALVVAITGIGPLKAFYEDIIRQKCFKHVDIVTLWLSAEDYPKFLACADLGISLHMSSSGLDLPMKVVDMFGSELPVCAMSYSCVTELVKNRTNGLLFSTSSELATQLQELFSGFPQKSQELEGYRSHLKGHPLLRWEENWNRNVLPLVQELCS